MSLATAMMVLIVACGISEVGVHDMPQKEKQEGLGSAFRTVCCVSGFEYPSGYDWNKEEGKEEAKCSLVVFADGVPEIKVPAGDGYEVSRDPDMHRVMDGNLYTFWSKDGKTVIRRNGAPLFRYDADEVPVDMAVKDEDLYILAHKRSGSGFSFRKNGKIMFERLSGETFGKLWEDGDSLCFAFMQPVALADGLKQRYYISYDSVPVHVPIPDDAARIWDIMSENGKPCMLVSMKRLLAAFLYKNDDRRSIELPGFATMLSCSLFHADSLLGVECAYTYPDGLCESGIWIEGSEYMRFEIGCSIQSLKYKDGKAYCILSPDEGEDVIFSAGEMFRMPEGYYCEGEQALTVHEGELHVALSSRKCAPPLIWHGGRTDTLKINGNLSCISFAKMQAD